MIVLRNFAAAALFFGLAAGARGGILYDNLGAPPIAPPCSCQVAASGPLYNSFTTAATGFIATIQLLLDDQGAANPRGVINVAIYDDNNDKPDGFLASLGTVDDTALSGTPSVVTFGVGQRLTPDTRYWIGLTDQTFPLFGSTSIDWVRAVDSTGIGVAGEFSAHNTAVLPNGDGTNGTGSPNEMLISTPEPTGLTLLGVGLVGMAVLRRRFA